MRAGRASQTAVIVCAGRAVGHGSSPVPGFSDPTALALLPDGVRARVERVRSGGFMRRIARRMSTMMAVRTVAIDDAIRAAASPQVVILGAGLDGRAWRMPELLDATVFEVDHPDTQRAKRARIAAFVPTAREVRFVAIDFTRDDLDRVLERAGHDRQRATTWVWEGVVMYLARAEVDATLDVIRRRSATGSRVIIAYHAPARRLWLLGAVVRRLGEPLRSSFSADAMRALVAGHGLDVIDDRAAAEIGAAMSPEVARATRFFTHLRIAIATRRL